MAQTIFKYKENIDSIIINMADQQLIKQRFDVRDGYCRETYLKIKTLKRVLETTDTEIDLQRVKDLINKIQIQYS